MVDRNGVPPVVSVLGASVHDSQLLEETVDAIPLLLLPIDRSDDLGSVPRSSSSMPDHYTQGEVACLTNATCANG